MKIIEWLKEDDDVGVTNFDMVIMYIMLFAVSVAFVWLLISLNN